MSTNRLVAAFLLLIAFNGANANLIDTTHGTGAGSFELGIFVDGAVGPGQPRPDLPGQGHKGRGPGF